MVYSGGGACSSGPVKRRCGYNSLSVLFSDMVVVVVCTSYCSISINSTISGVSRNYL